MVCFSSVVGGWHLRVNCVKQFVQVVLTDSVRFHAIPLTASPPTQ